MEILLLIVLAGFLNVGSSFDIAPRKLNLAVYYESKCPDSRKFVKEQLRPAVELLGEYLNVELIPFGKSQSIHGGYTRFECQHGPTECLGNMLQSCALQQMRGRPDREAVSYVDCEMRKYGSTTVSPKCVIKSQLSWELVNRCMSSTEGIELQLRAEQLTKRVRPRFVPTTTVNGVFDQQFQDNSLVDLIGTLCSILNNAPQCGLRENNVGVPVYPLILK